MVALPESVQPRLTPRSFISDSARDEAGSRPSGPDKDGLSIWEPFCEALEDTIGSLRRAIGAKDSASNQGAEEILAVVIVIRI
jgi:hypothetical protein